MNLKHVAKLWLVPLAAVLLATGCGASWQFTETAPQLPPPPESLRKVPEPPAGRWDAKADDSTQLEAIAPKALPDLRNQAVAMATLAAMPDAVRKVFEREWSVAALRRGAAYFLDPRTLQRLEVRRERAETKGAVKETTQWSGGIDQMATLAKVSAANLLLQLEVRDVAQVQRTVEWAFVVGAKEVAAYGEQLKAFRDQQEEYAKQLRTRGGGYAQRFLEAKEAYEGSGGRYDESAGGQRAGAAVEAHARWASLYKQYMALTTAGATLPKATEQALQAAAERERGSVKAAAATQLVLEAKLQQVETGELLWAGRLTAVGTDATGAAAIALDRLLAALVPAAKATAPATSGAAGVP